MWIIYFILGAFARRWYGGLLENNKILSNRGVQSAFMILLFMTIYVKQINDVKSWIIAIIISLWLQFQFWSRGHGCCFDIGRGNYPNEDLIKRYNERWYHIPCDWLAKNGFFSYYGEKYDFYYMTLRYTCPMLPMMFFNCHYILIGLSIAYIYSVCWTWYGSYIWKFNSKFCGNATNLAEIICGGLVYACCYLLGV